jgi:demethylmenaquinone methyltransferase/2-methoxy-6-polyprenyl-1,4-benzoquinol methylase
MTSPPPRDERAIRGMFDAIAPAYDRLNHLLSFGLDRRWRRKAADEIMEKCGGWIVDIAAGTGDFSFEALRAVPARIVAIDFAEGALRRMREKAGELGTQIPIYCLAGNALSLPFKGGSFDAALIAFGIRNFVDPLQSLREIFRILRPTGVVCILELSRPRSFFFGQAFRWYFHTLVPLIGRAVSGHVSAYRYLPESVDAFPEPASFVSLMNRAGFERVAAKALTLGVAVVYVGRKD